MTFIERIESLSTRFLSERTYELIVAPAIADLQHDSGARRPRGSWATLRARRACRRRLRGVTSDLGSEARRRSR